MTLSPLMDWLIFFFFLSYTSVYYQKKNLSRVSRSPYLLLIQVEEEKEDKKVCCTQAHLSTSSNPPFYLSLGRFFFLFLFSKERKTGASFCQPRHFHHLSLQTRAADSLTNTRERIGGNIWLLKKYKIIIIKIKERTGVISCEE